MHGRHTRTDTPRDIPADSARAPTPPWGPLAYFLFFLKNIIGWILILLAWPVGALVPGPGGIPLFLIGFALIAFPGKRRLTARVLRGLPIRRESRAYHWAVAAISILVPAALLSYFAGQWFPFLHGTGPRALVFAAIYIVFVVGLWTFLLRGVNLINLALRAVPTLRRRTRPWLHRRGLHLLPPRRRRRFLSVGFHTREPDEGILEIHERHHHRLRYLWRRSRPWLVRGLRVLAVAAIFALIVRPMLHQWPAVRSHLRDMNWLQAALAAVVLSVFLFLFRAAVWRSILLGLGHRLPLSTVARIWSISELARYVPATRWRLVSRMHLLRPYGIRAAISFAGLALELTIFTLANLFVAIACLSLAGFAVLPPEQRHWLLIPLALVPGLLLLLHPRISHTLLDQITHRLQGERVSTRLSRRHLAGLFGWTLLGLLGQGLAVWMLTSSVLFLPLSAWWILAGAYCLAWTVGFSLSYIFPAGMGAREAVFILLAALFLPPDAIPPAIRESAGLPPLLGFVGILLRLWAIAGEILTAAIALAADRRAAVMHNGPLPPGEGPKGQANKLATTK